MHSSRTVGGEIVNGENPDWGPLLQLAPDVVDDFMWMFEIAMEDGRRLHAYKHCETRRYLHLDCDGAAFVFTRDERYQQVDASWLLAMVLAMGPNY